MKRFREIIQDIKAPGTSDLWINDGKLKYFNNGAWENLGSSESDSSYTLYYNNITDMSYQVFIGLREAILNGKYIRIADSDNKSYSLAIYANVYNSNLIYLTMLNSEGILINTCHKFESNTGTVTFQQDLSYLVGKTSSTAEGRIPVSTNESYQWSLPKVGAAVSDTPVGEAATVESVASTLNALLTSLRTSGIIQN